MGDNVVLSTTATVNWKIADVAEAARMAAETMNTDGTALKGGDITKLRLDVLKQAQASLSCFIGTVRYGSSVDVSAVVGLKQEQRQNRGGGMKNLYDLVKLQIAVDHANDICNRYGIQIISINI